MQDSGPEGPHKESNEQMTYATQTSAPGLSLVQRIAEFAASVTDRLARNRVYHATVAEFASLSDRALADLGVGRGDIRSMASQAAFGK